MNPHVWEQTCPTTEAVDAISDDDPLSSSSVLFVVKSIGLLITALPSITIFKLSVTPITFNR